LQDGVAALTADNTAIRFVGTKPDGTIQRGSFGEVAGSIEVGGAAVKAVSVEIKTESLTAGIDRLTTHLKSADFFSVKEHPTASFTSTSVAGSMVTGELTMLGKTNEISFPVTATVTGEGLSLTADFKIDRLQFGMNYGEGDIDKEVTLNVAVGAGSGEPAEGEGASE
jgi:polyisoprenoid-binding protein YceI